ncbi:peroxin 26 [Phlyctema vagabunda]|uniref:Peroxin 26 n=1 Tax=Phlyctema vagabunda TaxID=108571 RepID=A0ABR4PNR5_9HELO
MASNGGSIATALNPTRETLSSSQLLSSSVSSLSNPASSRQGSSQISKIYRQSSTLFLTRRLPESLSTILPVITPPSDDPTQSAPIAKASRTTRIKVWSLYLTILNAVVELDPDEGKQAFGSQEWRGLVAKVRDGEVWEEVIKNGYGGVEGDVDSDVVINLATLLLAHARTQILNQQRLEAYLAASSHPNLDIADHLQKDPRKRALSPTKGRGTDTPRDLNARVKILELYTLHVLLRNNEWDYAREFISISEVLDEERREAFLQALQSLQDEQNEAENREREERRYQEEQLQKDIEDARRKRAENEERERKKKEEEAQKRAPKRASSETDYGVEPVTPSGASNKTRSTRGGSSKGSKSKISSPQARSAAPKNNTPQTLIKRAAAIIANLQKVLENMAVSFKTNPMVLLRFLAFMIGLLIVLSRRDVKQQLRKMWDKVKATAGMGVKVSYI